MRYDNDYIDGLLSVHIFKKVYMWSCDRISCKAHMGGERMHKVFWADWIGTLVAMAHGNIKLPLTYKFEMTFR